MDPEYKNYKYQPSSPSGSKTATHKGRVAIAVILALLIIGGSSYTAYSWQNQVKDLKAQKTSQSKRLKQLQKELALLKNDKEDDSRDTSSLEISQWGINLKLTDYDKVTYTIDSKAGELPWNGEKYESSLSITIKDTALQDKKCSDIGLALLRAKTKPSFENVKIGSYYYFVTGSPSACSTDPDNSPDDKLRSRLTNDFKPENISQTE
jgi:hypothetical protein